MVCTVLGLCSAAVVARAQTFNSLLSFQGTDGAFPYYVSLVQGENGNLYGTTAGYGEPITNGYGNVFEITPTGTLTALYSFCSETNCTDGKEPMAGLVQATNGNFYGTTSRGGANGYGTVFQVTPSGKLTTLYSFCLQTGCTDGEYPEAALLQAANGYFYGTTLYGGANGYGTVFEITPAGKLNTLHSFEYSDGASPYAGVIQARNGNFYGTTSQGGANGNYGTVFEITPAGTLTTLYSFCSQTNCADGESPYGGLVQATNGNLYGTTVQGGANSEGTVFEITAAGKFTTLHSFDSTDGEYPYAGLVQATDGNFYGTTYAGGASFYGTVFEITPAGELTTLHSFDDTDGSAPFAGMVQATRGSFYGVTFEGGTDTDGTVFSLSVGLGPFVQTLPSTGKVGANVIILGTDLTGATNVSFNGTAATFTVASGSKITTAVPTGATTGTVEVTTPKGTLKSNVAFQVKP